MIINRNINANYFLICIMRTKQANVATKRESFSLVIVLQALRRLLHVIQLTSCCKFAV